MSDKPYKFLLVTAPISKLDRSIDSFDFFAGLVSELAIVLQRRYPNSEIIIKVPGITIDYHSDQIGFVNAGIQKKYDCIIISPYDVNNIIMEFNEWKNAIKEQKIVFIDQGFEFISSEQVAFFVEDYIEMPAYVQANWMQGGQAAAESAYTYLLKRDIKSPLIVLLEGGVGSKERISGFRDHMNSKKSEVYPTFYTHNALYDKQLAKEFFLSYIEKCISSSKYVDIVFAANDEMALGAREALNILKEQKSEKALKYFSEIQTKIIGFDGIKDLTLLIDSYQDKYIYDTICVRGCLKISSKEYYSVRTVV
jgi:hypothetical protein